MTEQTSTSQEKMFLMPWDENLQTFTQDVRSSLSLNSRADVVRLALQTIPGTLPACRPDQEQPGITGKNILAPYNPGPDARKAAVRADAHTLERAGVVAALLETSLRDFAYRCTRLMAEMEMSTPGFRARISATEARTDLVARRVFRETDIQPWGEQDYRDYGRLDDK